MAALDELSLRVRAIEKELGLLRTEVAGIEQPAVGAGGGGVTPRVDAGDADAAYDPSCIPAVIFTDLVQGIMLYLAGAVVFVGGQSAPSVRFVSSTVIEAVVPPGAAWNWGWFRRARCRSRTTMDCP